MGWLAKQSARLYSRAPFGNDVRAYLLDAPGSYFLVPEYVVSDELVGLGEEVVFELSHLIELLARVDDSLSGYEPHSFAPLANNDIEVRGNIKGDAPLENTCEACCPAYSLEPVAKSVLNGDGIDRGAVGVKLRHDVI